MQYIRLPRKSPRPQSDHNRDDAADVETEMRSACAADIAYLEIGSYLGGTLVLTFLNAGAEPFAKLTRGHRVCMKLVACGLGADRRMVP